MPKGFMGRILWVNLTDRSTTGETLDEALYRQFLGGYGLGVKILYDRMDPGVQPLGPENILGFVPGLLTGTGTPFSGRFSVVCKSPLTGGWGDANCGGYFGPELRRCGYDGLFITGASPEPVYLTLHQGEVKILDATDLWGMDAPTVEAELQRRHGANWQVAEIGQAGENLALIAGIVTDRGRLAARSGVGAVMGSKKLKAIAVKGHLAVTRADVSAFKAASQEILAKMHPMEPEPKSLLDKVMAKLPQRLGPILGRHRIHIESPHQTTVWAMANQGTPANLTFATESGDAPIKNWGGTARRDFAYERARKIGEEQASRFNTGPYACSACPLHCGAEVKVAHAAYKIEAGHRVEYEPLVGFGPNLLIDDSYAIQYAYHLCNLYGLDAISAGVVAGFAFECFERGLITEAETGGVALRWGDPKAMLELIHQIGHRRHIGAVLADGVKRAAEQIGRGSEAFAIHAGGQELPFHDPKLSPSYATTYLTDPTPGRHTAGGAHVSETAYGHPIFPADVPKVRRYDYAGKGPAQAITVKMKQVQAAAGLCEFSGNMGTFHYEVMLKGACGWECDTVELLAIGDRIQTLRQAFNCREGIRPADWRLPDRVVGKAPLPDGPTAGVVVDVDAMARGYFEAMEFDPATGWPDEAKLRRLGLDSVADELYHGILPGHRARADGSEASAGAD